MMDELLFSPLPTPSEMNGWDKASAQMGLKTELLMENASREAFRALSDKFGGLRGRNVLCLAGPGNNGGDAIALARHLHDAGAVATLLLARPAGEYKGAPGFHLRLARRAGVDIRQVSFRKRAGRSEKRSTPEDASSPAVSWPGMADAPPPDIMVDGLLGTGLKGDPRPDFAALIDAVNRLGECAFVLALDIPSGLSGLTGAPSAHTVVADMTVTFEAAKLGLALPQAKPFIGELAVPAIGIPGTVREAHPPAHHLLAPGLSAMLPGQDPGMHKGSAGRLLVVGGSPGLTGAPLLAALGALRAGAGLVTVACPRGIEPTLKAGYPDVMTLPLGEGREWTRAMAREIAERLSLYDALVVGPGIGRGADSAEFLSELADVTSADTRRGGPLPCIWDADALYWLAANPGRLSPMGRAVVTPHPGEAARLLDKSIADVEADRTGAVRELSRVTGATAILKGPATLVCAPGEAGPEGWPVFVSPFMEPNLAVGGSGDVLAGVMGSLLARDVSPLLAASLGVYWHGLAGRLVSGDFPYRGNLATDIVQALPRALTEWLDAES